jgi:hypothetical protein
MSSSVSSPGGLTPNEETLYDILNLVVIMVTFLALVFYLNQIMKYFQAQRLKLADADGNTI